MIDSLYGKVKRHQIIIHMGRQTSLCSFWRYQSSRRWSELSWWFL